jgi:hyperosmotically inducible protein
MKNANLYLLALTLLLVSPLPARPQQSNAAPATNAATAQTEDSIPALPAHEPRGAPASEQDRIAREVRHELVMQPYYTLWDWLAFRVHGSTVELLGDVDTVGLKRDAVNSIKEIEGVDKVIDHINQLPPSPMDDRIRKETARSIFGWADLSRYSWSPVPSIHIIVNGGRVRLEGVVDKQSDKDAAGIRANQVPGVFQVTNNLRVVKD